VGDPNSGREFHEFYLAHFERVVRAVYLVLGSREEARDIAQEAFARTWSDWGRIATMDQPIAYTLRMATNLSKSRLRRVITLRRLLGKLDPRAESEDSSTASDLRVTVRRAIAGLPPRQRWVLVLCDLLGHSSEEAGAILGIAPSTVRVHHARAREALAVALSEPPVGHGGDDQRRGSPRRVGRHR
jgi:RNA polymerase sigma-70 factor (ECF subfamily)